MISVIIPSRNEPYLNETLHSLFDNATGELEVILTIDEDEPTLDKDIIEDKRITFLRPPKPEGMRAGINAGLKLAKGKYVMKVDAHCCFGKGFDEILLKDMQDDWLVVPRRYSLNADKWDRDKRMYIKDYHYIQFPYHNEGRGWYMTPQVWTDRTYKRKGDPKYLIDDTMSFQGSMWLAEKDFFMKTVGYLNDSEDAYCQFSGEQLETGLNYWLKGGQVKVNKNTWYAHLFKNKNYYYNTTRVREAMYKKELKAIPGWNWAAHHWINNEEPGIIHPMSWLVEKFWPVPSWPEDRKEWKL